MNFNAIVNGSLPKTGFDKAYLTESNNWINAYLIVDRRLTLSGLAFQNYENNDFISLSFAF